MPNFRVTFSKDGVLIYISHLDLNHAFIRALNRADVELQYSQGFNPHPKLVFALPLSVGMSGENELLDIGVQDESMTSERLRKILEKQMPPHITIKKVENAEKRFKDISAARYCIRISENGITDKLTEFFAGEISVLKKTKSGEKEVVISGGIKKVKVLEKDGRTVVRAILSASPDEYLSPELIMKAMREKGIISEDTAYECVRESIFFGSAVPEL